jgi:hypothetical protein
MPRIVEIPRAKSEEKLKLWHSEMTLSRLKSVEFAGQSVARNPTR